MDAPAFGRPVERGVLVNQAAGGARVGGLARGVAGASIPVSLQALRSTEGGGTGAAAAAGGAPDSPLSQQEVGQAMQAACPESRLGCSCGAEDVQSPGTAVPAAASAAKPATTACSAMA
jgi:hypothetical protein